MDKISPGRRQGIDRVIFLFGTVAALFGLLVMSLWWLGHPEDLGFSGKNGLPPLQAGLAFLLAGISLAAAAFQARFLVAPCAALLFFLALATLLEHGITTYLGFDFFASLNPGNLDPLQPRRMAPGAAVAFLLLGLALFLEDRHQPLRGFFSALCGAVVLAMSGVAALTHLVGITPLATDVRILMFPSAAVFLAWTGTGIVVLAWRNASHSQLSPRWLPLPVAVGAAAAAVAVIAWQTLASEEEIRVQRIVEVQGRGLKRELELQLSFREAAISRSARHWELHGNPEKNEWAAEGKLLLDQFPDFLAVEWHTPAPLMQWSVSRANAKGEDFSTADQAIIRSIAAERPATGSAILSRTADGLILVVAPVRSAGVLRGIMVGQIRPVDFLKLVLPALPELTVEIREGDRRHYGGPGGASRSQWVQTFPVIHGRLEWDLRAGPATTLLDRELSVVPAIAGITGLLLALALGMVVRMGQTARQRSHELEGTLGELNVAMTERRRAQGELESAHAQLERRVSERTSQLARANESLQAEVIERKRMEQQLRHGEQLLADFFDNAAIGLHWLARDGTILKINQAELDMLGCPRADCVGNSFRAFHADPGEADEIIVRLARGDMLENHPARMRSRDGTVRDVLLDANVLWQGDRFVHSRCFVRDVTALKATEAELRRHREQLQDLVDDQTRRLREINAELESFSYTVSHDLRAPLRAMQGFADALLEDYSATLDPTANEYAQRIAAGARRMDALIQDLLVYSRLTRIELTLVNLPIGELVREAADQVAEDIHSRKAIIETIPPLPEISGHRGILVQVLANLISNGVKFVPAGTLPKITISAETRGNKVRIWVADNGIGIAQEHHDRIFRVFERLHGVETYPGTGIGLAIVRKGMERIGGTAGVESLEGGGSRFWIELAAAKMNHE